MLLGVLILPWNSSAQNSNSKKFLQHSVYDAGSEEYVQELLDSAMSNIPKERKEITLIYSIEAIKISSKIEMSLLAQQRFNDDLGAALSSVGAHSYAIAHAKKAIELTKTLDTDEYFGLVWRYGRVGSFYLHKNQGDSALYYFRKAIPMAIKHGRNIYIASAYNNLGIGYSKIKHDSSLFCFNYAKSILRLNQTNDSALLSSINDNLADFYFEKSNFTKAEPLYKWNFKFLSLYPKYQKRAMEAGIQLATIYLQTKDFENFNKTLIQLKQGYYNSDYSQRRHIAQLEAQYYSNTGQKEKELVSIRAELEALDLLQANSVEMQKLVSIRLNDYSVKRIEKQLELEKLKTTAQKNLLELSEQKSINRLTWIWASILSALLIIIILYLNYRKKIEQRKSEKERLDNELALKKRDLEDFALELVQNQDWTNKLSEKLLEIKNLDKEEVSLAVRTLLNEVKGTQIAAKQKKVFQKNIAEVNHSFFEKLNQQFGNLTKTERELAGLLRMELSNKEIANLRNVEVSSVKRARSRLRKKLNLPMETDIYSFLISI